MKFWPYILAGVVFRATLYLFGETPAYIVAGIIVCLVVWYWSKRAWQAIKRRRQRNGEVAQLAGDHAAHESL